MNLEQAFSIRTSSKGPISRIYKELSTLNSEETSNPTYTCTKDLNWTLERIDADGKWVCENVCVKIMHLQSQVNVHFKNTIKKYFAVSVENRVTVWA